MCSQYSQNDKKDTKKSIWYQEINTNFYSEKVEVISTINQEKCQRNKYMNKNSSAWRITQMVQLKLQSQNSNYNVGRLQIKNKYLLATPRKSILPKKRYFTIAKY